MKKALLICLIAIMFGPTHMLSQSQYEWGHTMGSSQRDEITGSSLGPDGSLYVTGIFEDSIDRGDGQHVRSNGYRDIYLAKYGPDGQPAWAFGFGNIAWDRGWAITSDDQGNVYAGGVFSRKVDFDPGPDSTFLTSNTKGFWPDGYLAKYNTNGELVWAHHLLTARNIAASQTATLVAINDMHIDANGDLLIAGAYWDTLYLSASTMLVASPGLRDMFLAKYDSNGNLIWGHSAGGASDQQIQAVHTDPQGNVFTTGWFFGTAYFDPMDPSNTISSAGSGDAFLAKFDTNGDFEWVQSFGSNDPAIIDPEGGYDIGIDQNGHVYMTGVFYGDIDVDPGANVVTHSPEGSSGVFCIKYDQAGQYLWSFSLAGAVNAFGKQLAVLPDGNFYLAGDYSTSNGMDLDPGADSSIVYSLGGSQDLFIAKYNADGDFMDGRAVRGLNQDELLCMSANENEQYLGGIFENTILLDQQSGDLRFSKGNMDMFVVKYSDGSTSLYPDFLDANLQLYPNPSKDWLQVDLILPTKQAVHLEWINAHGQLLGSKSFNSVQEIDMRLNVQNWPQGIYIIRAESPQGTISKRFIVE